MSGPLEQGVESALFIEGKKIIAAADMLVCDEYLRNCMASCALTHLVLKCVISGDVVLYERNPLDTQEVLGSLTIETVILGVNFSIFH
jgi:hypothetical protein